MEVYVIGLCRWLRFGIDGIIEINGRRKSSSISMRKIGLRFTARTNTNIQIFDRDD